MVSWDKCIISWYLEMIPFFWGYMQCFHKRALKPHSSSTWEGFFLETITATPIFYFAFAIYMTWLLIDVQSFRKSWLLLHFLGNHLNAELSHKATRGDYEYIGRGVGCKRWSVSQGSYAPCEEIYLKKQREKNKYIARGVAGRISVKNGYTSTLIICEVVKVLL